MKNLEDIKIIPNSLQEVMTECDMTLNDIDRMDFHQFRDFCAQLDKKKLNSLYGIVANEMWKAHIFYVLDTAAFIENKTKK